MVTQNGTRIAFFNNFHFELLVDLLVHADKDDVGFHKIKFYVPAATGLPGLKNVNVSICILMMWTALICVSGSFPDKFDYLVFINLTSGEQILDIDVATYLMVIRALLKTAYSELFYVPEPHLISVYCTKFGVRTRCLKNFIELTLLAIVRVKLSDERVSRGEKTKRRSTAQTDATRSNVGG